MNILEMNTRQKIESISAKAAKATPIEGRYDLLQANVLANFPLIVDKIDGSVAHWLIMTGYWESWITAWFVNNIKQGWHCIDVGANYGYFSFLLAKLVGKTGSVDMVEANPFLCGLLGLSIDINKSACPMVLSHIATYHKDGEQLTLSVIDNCTGGANIYGHGDKSYDVKSVTLDTYSAGESVDFIKIDIEGAELETWQGMQDLIKRNPNVTILMEVVPKRYHDPIGFLESIQKVFPRLRWIDYSGNSCDISIPGLMAREEDGGLVMLHLCNQS